MPIHERTQPTQSIQPLTQDTFWFKMVSLHILIQPYQLICILWVYNQFCMKTYHQWVQRFETIQITIWKIITFQKTALQRETKMGSSANPRYGATAPFFSHCNPVRLQPQVSGKTRFSQFSKFSQAAAPKTCVAAPKWLQIVRLWFFFSLEIYYNLSNNPPLDCDISLESTIDSYIQEGIFRF